MRNLFEIIDYSLVMLKTHLIPVKVNMIKKIIILVFLFLSLTNNYAQNLIANPYFIDRNVCEEMNAACGPEAWFMASNAVPGGKTVSLTVFNSSKRDLRQYLQTELLISMLKDSIYSIKLTVLAGECLVNSLGVKFTEEVTCLESDRLITGANLDFSSQMNTLSKNKQKKWIDLTYSYKAKGGERFILIGCFVPDSKQNRNYKDKATQYQNYSYFFNHIEVKATYLDELPSECLEVKNHLYNFNYRHTPCMYVPYEKTLILKSEITDRDSITPKKIDSLILSDFLFDFNSSTLKDDVKGYLLTLLDLKDTNSVKSIEVIGYSDNIGEDEYNIRLSLKRAEVIRQFLIHNGWSKVEIQTKGLGKVNPISDNSNEEGRAKNRRIEIIFTH